MLRASALLAIVIGLALALAEVQANWGEWQWWPWWLVDFLAAGLLLGGGLMTLRRHATGPLLLGMAWAFTAGMAWMSLAGNVEDGVDAGRNVRMLGAYTLLLSALLATAMLGALLTLGGQRPRSQH
jgi:hypothetical protein